MSLITLENEFQTNQEKYKANLDPLMQKYPVFWKDINYNPLDAKYFTELFQIDPKEATKQAEAMIQQAIEEHGRDYVMNIMRGKKHHPLKARRRYDYRLNESELQVFQQNGFVVSERLGVESFAEAYYRLYSDNLPVYITADSILHAWHRSFDAILKELEVHCFMTTLQKILTSMQQTLAIHMKDSQVFQDVDYFLAIALRLLSDDEMTLLNSSNQERYEATLRHIKDLACVNVQVFGKCRKVDFSQFKPRGHYESSDKLGRYFQAMMWLGRIDLRLSGEESNLQQVECALMLVLLVRSNPTTLDLWRKLDQTMRHFIGPVDSMTVLEFDAALKDMVSNGSLKDISSMDQLWDVQTDVVQQIQTHVSALSIGKQLINGATRYARDEGLPQSFTFLGQRFTLDAFALNKVVYDNITWEGKKVQRRIPSGLDVAFSVFKNDDVAAELAHRADDQSETAVRFRDGLPYLHALAATRITLDSLPQEQRMDSVYAMWLDCLRQLSNSTKHKSSSFHTKAWSMRILSSQLASWTQLKHDTVLYTKQSYTACTMCEHEDVFVEPVPEFWTSLRQMVERSATILNDIDLYEVAEAEPGTPKWAVQPSRSSHIEFLKQFGSIVEKLEEASVQLSRHESLSEEQVEFLKNIMEERHGSGGTRYLGWYPKLFYSSREDSGKWDPLVTDIHTTTADITVNDPGSVLHQGIGDVLTGLFTVNLRSEESPRPAVFGGPVFSYYEFTKPLNNRMSDSEWRRLLRQDQDSIPSFPEWMTSTYLVPGKNHEGDESVKF